MTRSDDAYMSIAVALARRGLGDVWPNPSVGCVIVRTETDGRERIVGRGRTGSGGRPHAETNALRDAGSDAKGATAFVSLEPCAHQGETPPCAQALAKAGVRRVVYAVADPDPRVSGKGADMLEQAGIGTSSSVRAIEAERVNAGFFKQATDNRPLVTLKIATTLDGKIAAHSGESKWITGQEARARAHLARAESDAIMIGSTTAIRDNPELTCRLPGLLDRTPVRIVCDGRLRLPLTSKLVETAREHPTWMVTLEDADKVRTQAFRDCGMEVIQVREDANGRPDLAIALKEIAKRGITRLLVEGGGQLHASLLSANLVDELMWFRAAKVIGGDGLPAIQSLGIDKLEDVPTFDRTGLEAIGEDLIETYEIRT